MTQRSLKQCSKRFLAWLKLHNRSIAAGLAMIVFAILMVICVVVIFESDETMTNISIETNITMDSDIRKDGFCEQLQPNDGSKPEDCQNKYNCFNIPEDLEIFLKQLKNQINPNCESIAGLEIQSSIFKDPLKEYWLYLLEPAILNLSIQSCNLLDIEKATFKGHPFSRMISLELIDLYQLIVLRKGSFYYLNSIKYFVISYANFHYNLKFEKEVFNGMDSLQLLRIQNCIKEPEVIMDILAYKEALSKLKIIDLSNNRLETIYDYTFDNAENLREIYLNNNLLTSIAPFAFWELPLELLRIDNNKLKYIGPDVFTYVHPTMAKIYASGNPWDCECRLEWFKKYSIEVVMMNDMPLVCSDDKLFDELETFCNPITTPRTVVCPEHFQFPIEVHLTDKFTHLVNTTLRIISNQDVQVEVFDIDGTDGAVEVVLTGNCSAYYMLWFPSGATQDYGCMSSIQGSVFIEDLNRGSDYTLCLIAPSESESASPFECLGFKVLPPWNERTWIMNEYQGMAMGIACSIILLITIITAVAMFYFIRQHPSMLKGNKRVIMVESKQADAIVMPKQYQGDVKEYGYAPPSLISYGQGYLRAISPQNNTYTYFEPPKTSICDFGHGQVVFQEDIIKRNSIAPAYDSPPYVKKRASQTNSVILPPPLPPPNRNMRMSVTFDDNDGLQNNYSTV